MERGLHDRDRVGLQDQVLLENYQSEDAFIDNLKKRFQENLIYTYIGHVLISVNPYKELPIYTEDDVKEYRKRHFFEAPPHVFALSDNAYRSLTEENRGQCILISGESGSGKTEASKKVLQFIAAATGHTNSVEGVKDKLLQSNPVLEAFGNAKTNRNDNSSRFGKYMDVQFDFRGAPEGGNILNYLLEKSRVVHQSGGERNFHIFYQLLAGADDALLQELHLKRKLDTYYYLSDGDNGHSAGIRDAENFRQVQKAMAVIEIPDEVQTGCDGDNAETSCSGDTHTCTVHTHTQPLAAKGEGTEPLLLLGTCLSPAGVKEQPGERAGGAERARLAWGMAQARVASLMALPRAGDTGNVLLPQPTVTGWSCSAPLPGQGSGTGTLWGSAGGKCCCNSSDEGNCVINNLDD